MEIVVSALGIHLVRFRKEYQHMACHACVEARFLRFPQLADFFLLNVDKRQTGFYACIHNVFFTFRYTGSDERNARESSIQKAVFFFFECLCFGVWDACRSVRRSFIVDVVACFFLFVKLREPRFPMAEHLQFLRFFKKKEIAEGTECVGP